MPATVLAPTTAAAWGLCVALCAAAPRAQPESGDWAEAVAKACEHPRYGMRLAVSKRIAAAGAAAVPAIRARAADHGAGAIPLLLVDAIAGAASTEAPVVALLREWALDRSFYWRAQALGGLAARRLEDDRARFEQALADRSHLYRIEGARGLLLLDGEEARAQLQPLIDADPDPRVRIRLARAAAENGYGWGHAVLIAALQNRCAFLGDAWGAREAAGALHAVRAAAGGSVLGFDPAADGEANAAALVRLRERLAVSAEAADGASFADAEGPFAGGLDLRSCRNGDLFVRWTDDGEIRAGLLGERRARVAAPAWAALRAELDAAGGAPGVHGDIVCDYLEVVGGAGRRKCAPGALPAGLVRWLAALAAALDGPAGAGIGEDLSSRLGQFTDTEK